MTEPFPTIEISDPAYEHDGIRVVTVQSPALGHRGDVSLWVPRAERIGTLLILLHGVYGSHWVWSLKAGAHRTAHRMIEAQEISPLVLAMPSDGLSRDGSAYLTWPGGEDVERWILDEVPAIARLAAPALQPDAKIAIAGLSMGGYGALRLGSKYPERFSAISAHSAITDITGISSFTDVPLNPYLACAPREELSSLHWLRTHRDRLPPLRFDCGVEDDLLESNRALHHALTEQKIVHDYTEYPGGHEWSYWQRYLPETLRHVDRHSQREKSR